MDPEEEGDPHQFLLPLLMDVEKCKRILGQKFARRGCKDGEEPRTLRKGAGKLNANTLQTYAPSTLSQPGPQVLTLSGWRRG